MVTSWIHIHSPFLIPSETTLHQEAKYYLLCRVCNEFFRDQSLPSKPLDSSSTECTDVTRPTISRNNVVSCHNPMKKIELLCTDVWDQSYHICSIPPFYKCDNADQNCNFVLHEWCTQLPAEVKKKYSHHPQHTIILVQTLLISFLSVGLCCL